MTPDMLTGADEVPWVRFCAVCGDELNGDNVHHKAGPKQDRDHKAILLVAGGAR
jgi:hypothetical protein